MTTSRLRLTRPQILAYRRHVGALDARLPRGRRSLRRAAWAGLQDSMPRAALLSIHARVEATEPSTWEDPSLVQLWGPRHHAYVVPARDLAVFSLGRLPDEAGARRLAEDLAARLRRLLDGTEMTYGEAGRALGEHPNRLRYAAPTGTVVMRWDGARLPTIWTVPAPEVDPRDARLELARRYLHVFGPTTPEAFAQWAGSPKRRGIEAFDAARRSVDTRANADRRCMDPRARRADVPAPRRGRGCRRGSSRAATRTSSSREPIASSSSPTRTAVARSGPLASGRVPSSSKARSSGRGGVRTRR